MCRSEGFGAFDTETAKNSHNRGPSGSNFAAAAAKLRQVAPYVPMSELTTNLHPPEPLVQDLRRLIVDARRQAAAAVNVGLTLLYWRLGDRIRRKVLGSERVGYGEQIVATLSHQLAADFGRGFERTTLPRMIVRRGLPRSKLSPCSGDN